MAEHNSENSDSMGDEVQMREETENLSLKPSAATSTINLAAGHKIEKAEIEKFQKMDKPVGGYITYTISTVFDMKGEKDSYSVERRYSQFRWLNKQLSCIPGLFLPNFPEKDYFNQFAENLITQRKQILQQFLNFVIKLDVLILNSTVIPFLTLPSAEFSLYMKEFPFVASYLPEKPGGILSYFKTVIPRMDLTVLKKLVGDLKVPGKVEKFEDDNFEQVTISSEQFKTNFLTFTKMLGESVAKMEETTAELKNVQSKAEEIGSSENIENLSPNDKTKKEGAKFIQCFNSIKNLCGTTADLFAKLSESNEQLFINAEQYGFEFGEIVRLNSQYKKIRLEINKADILISQYKGQLISESDLGNKKKYEELLKSLKEFKEIKENCLKIFQVNFTEGFEKFKTGRSDILEKMVKGHIEDYKKCLTDVLENLEKIEENFN